MTGTSWRDTLFVWCGIIQPLIDNAGKRRRVIEGGDDDDDDDGVVGNDCSGGGGSRSNNHKNRIRWKGTWIGCENCPDALKNSPRSVTELKFDESKMTFDVTGTYSKVKTEVGEGDHQGGDDGNDQGGLLGLYQLELGVVDNNGSCDVGKGWDLESDGGGVVSQYNDTKHTIYLPAAFLSSSFNVAYDDGDTCCYNTGEDDDDDDKTNCKKKTKSTKEGEQQQEEQEEEQDTTTIMSSSRGFLSSTSSPPPPSFPNNKNVSVVAVATGYNDFGHFVPAGYVQVQQQVLVDEEDGKDNRKDSNDGSMKKKQKKKKKKYEYKLILARRYLDTNDIRETWTTNELYQRIVEEIQKKEKEAVVAVSTNGVGRTSNTDNDPNNNTSTSKNNTGASSTFASAPWRSIHLHSKKLKKIATSTTTTTVPTTTTAAAVGNKKKRKRHR